MIRDATARRIPVPVVTHRLGTVALWAAPALALGALARWDAGGAGGPVLCPLRRCTGLACPGCGLTRAVGALSRGDLVAAQRLHPLVLLAVVDALVLWALALLRRHRPAPPWPPPPTRPGGRLLTGVVVGQAVLFLVVWALRLADGSIDVVE